MARVPFIAGNWKMYKTATEAVAFIRALPALIEGGDGVEVVVAPTFLALPAAVEAAKGTKIGIASQNLHFAAEGAYTGEVSASMVKDAGAGYAIIGHSERRQYFAETDESVNKKVHSAMAAGLVPIVCVGETLAEREAGNTFDVVKRQLIEGLKGIDATAIPGIVVAYEPVWAIGTGKTASPEQAQEVHAFLRSQLTATFGADAAAGTRILYGGSVKPDNVDELMGKADIDGALVGGAALKPESFARLVTFKKA